jgi:5-methylcytosine-specific restriction enzyme A
MHNMAESIRVSVGNGEPPDFPREVGYEGESEMEGQYLLRWHAYRERKPGLRRRKIDSVLGRGDPLVCEVCKFDFGEFYGGQREVTIRDLALLCSNCHRMIHTRPPWPTPAELGELIRRQAHGQRD